MSFLVPKPIERQIRTKTNSNYGQNVNKSSIFDKIRDLCRTPNPVVERLDERVFISSVFDNIRELCRRPDLLSTIDDQLIEESPQESDESVVETKVYEKKKIQYYSDSNDSNPFEMISKSKLFATVMRGRPNQRVELLAKNSSDENSVTKPNINTKNKININKKPSKNVSNTKGCKNNRKSVRTRKPLLSIDCDITSKITEYSKQLEKSNQRTNRRKTVKKSVRNNSIESEGSGSCSSYESMASPLSTTITMSYSMPATPISSIDSMSSGFSCETSSSVLSQIRKSLNPKFETYGQYIQRCAQNQVKCKRNKRTSKQEFHFKEKVLQWSDKICSGNTTPLHNIEYLETPPGSPQKTNESSLRASDELNEILEGLENVETNESFNNQFNELLSELFSEIPF